MSTPSNQPSQRVEITWDLDCGCFYVDIMSGDDYKEKSRDNCQRHARRGV